MINCRYCGTIIQPYFQEEYKDYIEKWAFNKKTKELDILDFICMKCTENFGNDY